MRRVVVSGVFLVACSAPAAPPGAPVRAPPPITAPADAGAPPVVDAEPITALDVFHAVARTGSTLHWRVPGGRCQAWRFEPAEEWGRHGRIVAEDGARFGFDYAVEDGAIVLDARLAGGCTMSNRCVQALRPEADDDLGFVLGGGRWYYDRAECERGAETMPAGCGAMLLGLPAARRDAGDPIGAAIEQQRPLHLLGGHDGGYACDVWQVERERLYRSRGTSVTEYGLAYDGTTIVLTGPSMYDTATNEGMAMGCFEEHRIARLTDEVVLVGGWPWFATTEACEAARARTE